MALPGSRTNPALVAARFLLKPGRKYEKAVKAFDPHDSINEENPAKAITRYAVSTLVNSQSLTTRAASSRSRGALAR